MKYRCLTAGLPTAKVMPAMLRERAAVRRWLWITPVQRVMHVKKTPSPTVCKVKFA